MIKWEPFNSLMDGNKVKKDIAKFKNKLNMPSLSNDQLEEINYYLNLAIKEDIEINIKYFDNDRIKKIKTSIKKIDKVNKYLITYENLKIRFKQIISIFT